MIQMLKKTNSYFLTTMHSMTIKKASIITTLFIFLFTIVFAYLLIVENYNDYERALFTQKSVYYEPMTSEEQYLQTQTKLKALLIKNTIAIATLAFILFSIMLGASKIFNTLIQRDMQVFLDFFQKNVHKRQELNTDAIFFTEFKKMVSHANDLVDTIGAQKRDLKALNMGLEDKVREKTTDLVLINKNLEKEKIFSQDLLKAQKEFLRYTVHETNTSLSVILTSIDLYTMTHEKDRQLSKIEAAVKNVFNIYDDLSYLVKKDQVEYPKLAIDINLYLQSRLDFFTEVAQLSQIVFSYTPKIEGLYIYFNETKLQRIIDNTLSNAIKYTHLGKVVDIYLTREGSYLELSIGSQSKEIKDTEKIFDSFYREEKEREGFGIGLRLVKNICNEEDVGIQLDSNDAKTTFSYKFKMMGA